MNTENEIKKLFDKVNENKESLFVIHVDENDDFGSYACGNQTEIAAGIATIVYDGLKKNSDERAKMLANAIIDGVAHVLKMPSHSAAKVMLMLTKAMLDSNEKIKVEDVEKSDVDGEDNDVGENCEDCENHRWCPLPDAVKYRKENHIPAPQKRKNGKRGGKKNEN